MVEERVGFVDQVEAGLAERSVDRHSRQSSGTRCAGTVPCARLSGVGSGWSFYLSFSGWVVADASTIPVQQDSFHDLHQLSAWKLKSCGRNSALSMKNGRLFQFFPCDRFKALPVRQCHPSPSGADQAVLLELAHHPAGALRGRAGHSRQVIPRKRHLKQPARPRVFPRTYRPASAGCWQCARRPAGHLIGGRAHLLFAVALP